MGADANSPSLIHEKGCSTICGMQTSGQVGTLPWPGVVFVALFTLAMWCGACYLTSRMSGWHLLAKRFRLHGDFTGEQWRWVYGLMRWHAKYGGVLVMGADAQGLYMRTLWLFKVGHPPLLIPWIEIRAEDRERWFRQGIQLTLGRQEQIPLWVLERTAVRIRPFLPTAEQMVADYSSREGLDRPQPIE